MKGLRLLALLWLLTGCGGGDRTPATVIQVNVTASEQVNPDGSGRPSPVVARIYFLTEPGRFEAADFFALVQDASGALGDSLVSMEEVRLFPGSRQSFIREVDEDVEYMGVVAAYRNIDQALWRQLVPIPGHQTSLVDVRLKRLAVEADLIQHR